MASEKTSWLDIAQIAETPHALKLWVGTRALSPIRKLRTGHVHVKMTYMSQSYSRDYLVPFLCQNDARKLNMPQGKMM